MELMLITFVLFLIISILYSSVGHAGASGYLAIMSLLSFDHESIKPISLVLNIFVAIIAAAKYLKAGYFDKKIFISIIITSLPMAFVGGYITVNIQVFKTIAGVFLILSALLLILKQFIRPTENIKPMPLAWGLLIGAVIGFISGLIGVGGGVFLSPVIILAGWCTVKNASGVAAMFILCNSITALAGNVSSLGKIDASIIYWIAAVILGGFIGSHLGTRKLNNNLITVLLFLVLASAGLKFLLV